MKAYITTIGEKTTDICKAQLERFGFHVIVLDGVEPWDVKFARFIREAEGPCLRIDADVIPNATCAKLHALTIPAGKLMAEFQCYGLYKNGLVDSGVLYTQEAIDIIRKNLGKLDPKRPEASAWRLPETVDRKWHSGHIIGFTSFFQDTEHFARAKRHKIERKQIERYDFDLAERLLSL